MKQQASEEPAWLADHTKTAEPDDWTIKWIRSCSAEQQKMLLRFPPSCVVKGKVPLGVPSPGRFGIVVNVSGKFVYVIDGPEGDIKAECKPNWLEVVGYWKGWTPERVAETLRSLLG